MSNELPDLKWTLSAPFRRIKQYPNPYITPNLCFSFHYFATRKFHFVLRAKALVALPGGYGTFDELFEVLTLVQTQKLKQIPVILVGKDFWQRAVNFDFLADARCRPMMRAFDEQPSCRKAHGHAIGGKRIVSAPRR